MSEKVNRPAVVSGGDVVIVDRWAELLAATVAHLAGLDAGWTTGQILQVNGGTPLRRG